MMIHFLRPYWLWLLIPVFLYLLWVILATRQINPWKKVCDAHLLIALLESNSFKPKIFFNISLFTLFIISIFALAGPAWKKTELPIYRDVNSFMVVLDLSPMMQVTDIKPNRLTRAKLKIQDLINNSENSQMGLVVFTEEAFIASPLSQDANTLKVMLDDLYPQMMPISGSDSGQGLKLGLDLLKQTASNGNILLITASEPTANSWAAAKTIAESGNRLTILGMLESNTTTQSTISKLRQLATVGGGSFYLFTADSIDIQRIINNNSKQAVKDENIENAYLWQDAGPWFCLLLIPLALIVLREKMQYEKQS